ncbi:MAG: hypothetical protein ACOWWM_04880 [Desulfobacterales bacterium]
MRRNRRNLTTAMAFAFVILLAATAFAAATTVSLEGTLNNGSKGFMGDDGVQYTVIPPGDFVSQLQNLDGKRVELTGVTYVSHGRDMFTVLSFKAL